jgi:hypothetical protein
MEGNDCHRCKQKGLSGAAETSTFTLKFNVQRTGTVSFFTGRRLQCNTQDSAICRAEEMSTGSCHRCEQAPAATQELHEDDGASSVKLEGYEYMMVGVSPSHLP